MKGFVKDAGSAHNKYLNDLHDAYLINQARITQIEALAIMAQYVGQMVGQLVAKPSSEYAMNALIRTVTRNIEFGYADSLSAGNPAERT